MKKENTKFNIGDILYAGRSWEVGEDYRSVGSIPVFKLEEIRKRGEDIWVRPTINEPSGILQNNNIRLATLEEIEKHTPHLLEEYFTNLKWCVRGYKGVGMWFTENASNGLYTDNIHNYYHFPKYNNNNYVTSNRIERGYTELTLNQFNKYILKEEKIETKFTVGDIVKVVKSGSGVGDEEIGKKVIITEIGKYNDYFGYKVSPAIGNTRTGSYNGFIGERPFELVGDQIQHPVTRAQLKQIYDMACATWRYKIQKITRDAIGEFEDSGFITGEVVDSMYEAATSEQLPVIKEIFPKRKKKVKKQFKKQIVINTNTGDIHSLTIPNSTRDIDLQVITVTGEYEVEEDY